MIARQNSGAISLKAAKTDSTPIFTPRMCSVRVLHTKFASLWRFSSENRTRVGGAGSDFGHVALLLRTELREDYKKMNNFSCCMNFGQQLHRVWRDSIQWSRR